MRLTADITIPLPFPIDLCARGPNVEPMLCTVDGFHATLYFPPSLAEGTDGQGMFGDWAWWTGRSLRLILERDLEQPIDTETLRAEAVTAGDKLLRRFLNAYRWRLNRSEVHPVRLDPHALALKVMHPDGQTEELSDPVPAFLLQNRVTEPPLGASVNATTLPVLQADVQDDHAPAFDEQFRLDADALEAQGEPERAAQLRRMIEQAGGTSR